MKYGLLPAMNAEGLKDGLSELIRKAEGDRQFPTYVGVIKLSRYENWENCIPFVIGQSEAQIIPRESLSKKVPTLEGRFYYENRVIFLERKSVIINTLNSKPILYHYTFKSFLSTAFKISSCLLVNFTNFVTSNPFTESFM